MHLEDRGGAKPEITLDDKDLATLIRGWFVFLPDGQIVKADLVFLVALRGEIDRLEQQSNG